METKLLFMLLFVLGVTCMTEAAWMKCYNMCLAKYIPSTTTSATTAVTSSHNSTETTHHVYDYYIKHCRDYCNHHWFELQYNTHPGVGRK